MHSQINLSSRILQLLTSPIFKNSSVIFYSPAPTSPISTEELLAVSFKWIPSAIRYDLSSTGLLPKYQPLNAVSTRDFSWTAEFHFCNVYFKNIKNNNSLSATYCITADQYLCNHKGEKKNLVLSS